MKASVILLAGAMLAAPGWSQQAAPVRTGVQQDFEAATALGDRKDHAGALARWEALEVRTAKNPRSLALVRVRKGIALFALDRKDEAVAATRAGLAQLPTSDASLREDRFLAQMTLGAIAELSLDYASAAASYGAAEGIAIGPGEKLGALRGLIQAQTFVDPDAAALAVARADAAMAGIKVDPSVRAMVRRLDGQLRLNQGAFAASWKQSGEAVKLLGGLTAKTDLDDVAVRSNYAIAAILGGRPDDARQYMAMTGAGRMTKGQFDPGAQMKVPECGGEAGLKPVDVAVIEFSIDDDGVVRISAPVYAAGGGQVALEFARAARDWSWTPEQAQALPPFFRNRVRVELRCSTAFERPSIASYLDGELGAWLAREKVAMPPLLRGSDAVVLPQLRAQLATAETEAGPGGKDALTLVPILHQLSANLVIARDERDALAQRELAIAVAHRVPAAARLAIEPAIWFNEQAEGWKQDTYMRTMLSHLTDPAYAGDPVARSAIRLLAADAARKRTQQARELLTTVGGDAALPANHPLRVGALVRLASLEQAAGNEAAASAAFAQSGLSARQCALVDSAPRMVSNGVSSSSFPMEAMRWGFEGWTSSQFDVAADGKVVNQRIVVAYPPFVFSQAGGGIVKSARYEKSFRPDGGLGCGGSTQRVRFLLPS